MEGWLDVWDATAQPALESGRAGSPGPARRSGRSRGEPLDPRRRDDARHDGLAPGAPPRADAQRADHQRRRGGARRRRPHAARPDLPTAIAFVDLTGYTSLTERLGDEAAALTATRLAELADACARAFDGRVVKLLGDGVLMRFEDPPTAVAAVADLLGEIVAAGLPPGHAGIAAGRVVTRDGDIYGRTVNLAARIAAHAEAGQLLVDEAQSPLSLTVRRP